MNHTQQEKPVDERTYHGRREALLQLQEPRTPEELQEVLCALLALFQEQHCASITLINDYARMTEDLTATVTRLTVAVEELTAQRARLAEAAADAYEAGLREYQEYTDTFLADHSDQWEAYRRAYDGLVIAPDALAAIDPRPPDSAARLCHACGTALGQGQEEQP